MQRHVQGGGRKGQPILKACTGKPTIRSLLILCLTTLCLTAASSVVGSTGMSNDSRVKAAPLMNRAAREKASDSSIGGSNGSDLGTKSTVLIEAGLVRSLQLVEGGSGVLEQVKQLVEKLPVRLAISWRWVRD